MHSLRGCLILREHVQTQNQTHGNGEGDLLFSFIILVHSEESYPMPRIISRRCDELILRELYVQLLQQ